MARKAALALLLWLGGACGEVEEASLGTLTLDANADMADAEQADAPDTLPDAANPTPSDGGATDAGAPSISADAPKDAPVIDAGRSSDASAAHDAGKDAGKGGAHDAGREAGHSSLECRLEPWECR
jgi:hypothetical protein